MGEETLSPKTSVAERVDTVRSTIADHRAESERIGRLADPVVDALRDAGLYGLAVPEALGGLEVAPTVVLEAVETLSSMDAAVGWNVNQSQAGSYFAARLDAEGQGLIFGAGNPAPAFSGAAYPPCTALPAAGGFEVSGTVRFLSGCHNADWFFVIGLVPSPDAGGRPQARVLFLAPSQAEVLDTWHVLGMRGTGSADVRLDRAFVPEALSAAMSQPVRLEGPFANPMYGLFPWPLILGEAIVSIGVARAALELGLEIADTKVSANTGVRAGSNELVHDKFGRARALIESGRITVLHTMDDAHRTVLAHGALTRDQKVSLQLAACTAAENGARAVSLVYDAVGSAGFIDAVGLERHFRDSHVLAQHGTKSSPRFASAGKAMLGLDSDISLLA